MKNVLRFSLILAILLSFGIDAEAQKKRRKKKTKEKTEKKDTKKEVKDIDDQVEVVLKNGNRVTGKIVRVDSDSLIINSSDFGVVGFANAEVKRYQSIDGSEGYGDQYDKERYQSKYWITPTARPVGKGNLYYTNLMLFGNTFSYGVSDNFSLSAGFESISLFAGRVPVVYVSPKFSIPIDDKFHVGVGTTFFIGNFDDDFVGGGLLYGNTTIGSATKNITAGVAYGYSTDGDLTSTPLLQFGGTLPLSRKVSLMGELFTSADLDGALFSIGVRIVTRGNYLFDVGVVRGTGFDFESGGLGFPLFAFSVPM